MYRDKSLQNIGIYMDLSIEQQRTHDSGFKLEELDEQVKVQTKGIGSGSVRELSG